MSHDRQPAPARSRAVIESAFFDIQSELRTKFGPEAYASYAQSLNYVGEESAALYFRSPTGVARDWLNRNGHDAIESALRQRLRAPVSITICVEADLPARLRGAAAQTADAPTSAAPASHASAGGPLAPVNLTFETYCVGDANRAAVNAARVIVDGGMAASLVLFHGVHGVGKSHVAAAIVHEARRKDPDRRIRYVMGNLFVDQFQNALQKKGGDMATFKAQMRDVDLLVVDDVQALLNKPATESEFLTTIQVVLSQGGQVVLTADHGPDGLDGFETRLRNQLRAATDVLIELPDFELRRKILESKVKLYGVNAPNFDVPGPVLDMIASRIRGPGRQLDAAIRQLFVELALADKEITMESAERALQNRFAPAERRPSVEQIIAHTARYYNLTKEQLLAPTHQRAIARPRQIAMFLCRQMTRRSLPDLARRFGGKHHTTILWATGRIEKLIVSDEQVRTDVEAVRKSIQTAEPERGFQAAI
jgi:chromosomal replication initiator protein